MEQRSNRAQNLIIILCWAVYTFAYFGRYGYNSNITPIMADYGITKADAGLVSTFFFFAYGIGQVVNGIENENVSYAYTLEKAKEAGCAEDIAKLEEIGPPVDGQYQPVFEGLMAQRSLLKKYGGHSTKKGGYFSGTVLPILTSPELSLREKIGTAKGYKVCLTQMWPTIVHYDFIRDCGPFAMPYYIFQGRLDQNTPSSLVQAYYDSIEAPDKALVWFEHSAHGPLGEEPEKFKALMREKFLTIAKETDV